MNKYILPIVAVLLCMAACQKEEGRILTLEVENYADDGKMHLDGDNYAVWDDGDTVHLNNVSHIVTLTGSSATISGVTESGPYYAIYPDSWASNNNTITYPEVQKYRTNDGGFQILGAPMAALCGEGDNTLQFHNVGSILKVAVDNQTGSAMTVRRIEVTSDDAPISGTTTVNYSDFSVSAPTTGSNTVTLDIKEGVTIANNSSDIFYIALPPVSAKLTIKVYDDYYSYTKTQTSAHQLVKNHGYTALFSTDAATAVQYAPKPNEIWYTTANNSPITPKSMSPTNNEYNSTLGCCVMTFADTITTIPNRAFVNGQDNLLTVTLPASVKTIKNATLTASPFYGCNELTTVIMPGVTSIGNSAFYKCENLSSVDMPSVTSIGKSAFGFCDALTSVDMPNVETIGESAFEYCEALTSVDMPNVETIGESAFLECVNLSSVTMPHVVTIGSDAFYHAALTAITFPISLTSIGDNAFFWCEHLNTIHYDGTTSQWGAISKGSDWHYSVLATTVICSDGSANLD